MGVPVSGPAMLDLGLGDEGLPQPCPGHADHVVIVLVVHRPEVRVELAHLLHCLEGVGGDGLEQDEGGRRCQG